MLDKLLADDRGQMRMDLVTVIISAVVALVVGFVGIFLMSEVIGITALSSGDPLYNTSQSFQTTTDTVFGTVGLAVVIAVITVVIVYLYAVRGRGR